VIIALLDVEGETTVLAITGDLRTQSELF